MVCDEWCGGSKDEGEENVCVCVGVNDNARVRGAGTERGLDKLNKVPLDPKC